MLKIITDYEEHDPDCGEEVMVESIQVTFSQEPDCTESRDDNCQELTLETRDGGGGKFIHLKTKGWSISDENDLYQLIKYFRSKYEDVNNS